ncbi:class I SAM-dependent methyltransferase [Spirosoma linguale]|uniref:Methyltransferase type 12 n=1 Tax=Spirosoma linguale (strain ATCC 33905 / DSM 74 / LMG 10896 / Claus 1) TaxID=504472 RepID=D2QDT8_SPILD|nr:Methyltransferase type 12 [Spirosoma linguale DSM 74]
MDKSNGYEEIAARFIMTRTQAIGSSSVRDWAKTLPPNATVLDLGCGSGMPIAKLLLEEGMNVYGLDASPTMIQTFQLNFPALPAACEGVEDSLFFNRHFEAIIAWGLLFILPMEVQQLVLQKAAAALPTGGKLLFTAPAQAAKWTDMMTGQESISLGAEQYKLLLAASALILVEEFDDEGENHYYHAVKVGE